MPASVLLALNIILFCVILGIFWLWRGQIPLRCWHDLRPSHGALTGLNKDVCTHREGESKSFFEMMVRAREKEEILVGLKRRGAKEPELNPTDKDIPFLSLRTVDSFVVILTGVDPDKPSRSVSCYCCWPSIAINLKEKITCLSTHEGRASPV